MKRSLCAILTGASAAAVLVAVPLLHQRGRLADLPTPLQNGPNDGYSAQTARDADKAAAVLLRWKQARDSGSKSDGELRAAESVQDLTAAECRAAAETARRAGDLAPLSDLLGRWASLDGAAAFAWLDRHPDLIEPVLNDAAPAWAASDPAGYAAWLLAYDPPREKEEYKTTILAMWLAPYDLPSAIRIGVEKIGITRLQLAISKEQLGKFIRSPEDAQALGEVLVAHPEWMTNFPRTTPSDLLLALRECWRALDQPGFDRWLARHPALVDDTYATVRQTGGYLLPEDHPKNAADVLLSAAAPGERGNRLNAVITDWAEKDLNAAGAWLAAQPDAPDKWKAVRSFALSAVKEDPMAAMQWADSIPDPAEHARSQRRVFARWTDLDPAAAAAWLPESGWTDVQIQAARDILAAAPPVGASVK